MKKTIHILFIFGIAGFPNQLFAQHFTEEEQIQLDSLNAIIINQASHDTSLAAAYVGLSEILYVSNPDTIIPLCEKAKYIAENALAKKPSTSVGKSLKVSLAGALNNIGYIHMSQGDNSVAIEYYQQSLRIQQEIGDKQGMSSTYNNIGYIHQHQGNIPLALEFYHQSLKLYEEIIDKKGMFSSIS